MWRIGVFLKKTRNKLVTVIERIPRKLQVLINLLMIPLLALMLYIHLGSPAVTPEQSYRRFEKSNLVGPSEILGYETITKRGLQEFMLAETLDGIIVSAVRQPQYYHANDFFYINKTGELTVTLAPQELHWEYGGELALTMFLFDEYPQAVYAELDFELFWDRGGAAEYREWVHLKSDRKNDGYFRFDLDFTHNEFAEDPHAEAIYQLSKVFYWPNDWTLPEGSYPAVVRLYNADGIQIVEKHMQLFAQN